MIKSVFEKYLKKRFVKNYLYFIIVTLSFHFFFRCWALQYEYWPIKNFITQCYYILSKIVFEHSAVVITHIFEEKVILSEQQFSFINQGFIRIGSGCSGLKQMLQFLVLFLFIRGSIFKKIWFIPMGVLAIHFTNLLRIIGLSFITIYKAEYWQFSHDYLFRPLFYVVIFGFWIIWIEKIAPQSKSNIKTS